MQPQEFVELVARELVNKPEEVKVEAVPDPNGVVRMILRVAPEDMGLVIGKDHTMETAMREIVFRLAAKARVNVFFSIADPMAESFVKDAQALLEAAARALVNHPQEVRVEVNSDPRRVLFILDAHPQDRGQIVGKQGSTMEMLRALLIRVAGKFRGIPEVDLELKGAGAVSRQRAPAVLIEQQATRPLDSAEGAPAPGPSPMPRPRAPRPKTEKSARTAPPAVPAEVTNATPVAAIGLPSRVCSILDSRGILTVGQLSAKTHRQLSMTPGLTGAGLNSIVLALARFNRALAKSAAQSSASTPAPAPADPTTPTPDAAAHLAAEGLGRPEVEIPAAETEEPEVGAAPDASAPE